MTIYCTMCRTRRNEDNVDEDVDHEPARGATCKAELTVPNHYSKKETLLEFTFSHLLSFVL